MANDLGPDGVDGPPDDVEEGRAAAAEQDYERAWALLPRKHLRRWLRGSAV